MLELGDQGDDRGLHRDVERRGHLVAHEQRRRDRDGTRDRDALALAAGELIRVAVDHRRAEGDPLECIDDPLLDPLAAQPLEDPERLARSTGRSSCAG